MELAALEEELIRETQSNANKLNILSVLEEEKTFLEKLLETQDKNFEKWSQPPNMDLDRDIEKLLVLDQQQKQQIEVSFNIVNE